MLDNNCTTLTKCLNIRNLFSQEFNKCKNCNLLSFPCNNDKISGVHQGGISFSVPSPGNYYIHAELQPAEAASRLCLVPVKGLQWRVWGRLSLLVHLWRLNVASCSCAHQTWLLLTPLLLHPALPAFPCRRFERLHEELAGLLEDSCRLQLLTHCNLLNSAWKPELPASQVIP